MTAQEYIDNGFHLSAHISQNVIDNAEEDVKIAYIEPIAKDSTSRVAKKALMALSFLLILQRTIFGTRSGAKIKINQFSNDASEWQKLGELAGQCSSYLEELKKEDGANSKAEIYDICKIYFKSNFLYI